MLDRHGSLRRLSILVLFVAPTVAAGQSELPLTGVAGVPNGDAAQFAGSWSAIRPEGTSTTLTCRLPIVLAADGTAAITYTGLVGQPLRFALSEDHGRTLWTGDEPQVAVWTSSDAFILFPVLPSGEPDRERALLYERCPAFARSSHPGSTAGALEPFAGHWSVSLPPRRGSDHLQVDVGCDAPATFVVVEGNRLLQTIPGSPDVVLDVGIKDGETLFPNDGYPQIAIWESPDRWLAYGNGIDGRIDWNLPVIFDRCP